MLLVHRLSITAVVLLLLINEQVMKGTFGIAGSYFFFLTFIIPLLFQIIFTLAQCRKKEYDGMTSFFLYNLSFGTAFFFCAIIKRQKLYSSTWWIKE